jgi:beta-galactosidase/beta-glucuronidase
METAFSLTMDNITAIQEYLTLHPTPQMARTEWLDLCGEWDLAFDDDDTGLDAHWECRDDVYTHKILVPYPPEARASQLNETGLHPVVWYRTTFRTERPIDRERLLLHFGAVDYFATVWVNGQLVGEHRGGNTPFVVDITRVYQPGTAQVMVVRAEDQPLDLGQPRGKQDWLDQPHAIWYRRTTGIWQPVWAEWVSATYVEQIRWTPDAARGRLSVEIKLNRAPLHPVAVQVRLSLRGQVLAEDTYRISERRLEREIQLPLARSVMHANEILWSPEFPNLIDAEVGLLDGAHTLDEVISYVGMRSVGLDSGRFLLNGAPYYLRMVLEQGYWPETCLAAPSGDALRREVLLIKSLGFNSARIHQKVEDPRFLYWCDRLGLAVWGEMANAFLYSPEAAARLVQEWSEVVQRDYNHPCIVTWVPLNESWGAHDLQGDPRQREFLRALISLTKAYDSTRPVIDNDGWEHVETDILTLHDYQVCGQKIIERYGTREALAHTLALGRPIGKRFAMPEYALKDDTVVMLTEFGGISYKPNPGTPWFGYGTVSSEEEYLAKLDELIGAVLACPTISGFCYTQLTDTEQETNGLLTADRKPKFAIEALRKIITQIRIS